MSDQQETMEHKPLEEHRDFGEIRGTVIKLVMASLIVGFVMHWFGWTYIDILRALTEDFEQLFTNFVDIIFWIAEIILLGATIIVPVWLVVRLMGREKG
ncbi:MAG: hypothetical protein GDA49_02755 [Rhodospirillales bacterium]|nr:hypothetical protein [Rhodospirillales bacterium]